VTIRTVVQISVVIPVHNCELYVATAVESVLRQDDDDLEVIVVNDGSTDGTLDALAPYQDRIRILSQDHRGVASARNAGVAAARGTLIAFLDADDWWFQARLSVQLAALKAFPDCGLVFSDFCVADSEAVPMLATGIRWKYGVVRRASSMPWKRIFSESRTIEWTDAYGHPQRTIAYCGNIAGWLFLGNFINSSSVLVRRAALLQSGGFDDSLSTEEDYDCWLRIAQSWPMAFVDLPLVAFRRREGQLTAPDRIEQVLRNVAKVVQRAADRKTGNVNADSVKRRLSKVYRDVGIVCMRSGRKQEARGFLLRSLNAWPPHALTLVLLPMSYLPAGLFASFERLLHVMRHRTPRGVH
jgi:glycosyltransferase involved in cell wall biosynthesis